MTVALDDPSTDLDDLVAAMLTQATVAVESLMSVQLTITVDDYRFTLSEQVTGVDPAAVPMSSVLIPFGYGTDAGSTRPPAELVLISSTPGAFVDLAADASSEFEISLDAIQFDRHLSGEADVDDGSPTVRARYTPATIGDLSMINQAIGVYLDRGLDPADARVALSDHAERYDVSESKAAQHVIDEHDPPDPNDLP